MAYTIQFLTDGPGKRDAILFALQQRLAKDGRFRATLTPSHNGSYPSIVVKPVRLVKAKPYCGNHPGVCAPSARKKSAATYLEWDDWVKFHKVINTVLNKYRINANVWSNPPDVRGKMWIRRGTQARIKYDYESRIDDYGRLVHDWNQGTPDQFIK